MEKYVTHQMLEDVGQTGGFELGFLPDLFDSKYQPTLHTPHTHNFYEVIWFQEGGGVHTVDFVDYPIEPNTFFFISPGQLHKYDTSRQKGIAFKFVPEFLHDEYTTEEEFLKYSIFNAFDTVPRLVVTNEEALSTINSILMGMQREIPRRDKFGHISVLQSFVRLLLITFQRCESKSVNTVLPLNISNNIHAHFIRFRQALESEYRHMHSVKDYAKVLGVGTKYLTTIVTECSHRTPLQLINDRILLEAKRQLRYSNRMVKEIAFDLGFEDPSYFVKLFKRQTGMLPTEFREM